MILAVSGKNSHESCFSDAISDAFEAIFARHILPESVWRLQKWLGVGKERKLKEAWITLDPLFSQYISLKKKERSNRSTREDVEVDFNALELQTIEPLSIFRALTWFFWFLTKHAEVEIKIRQEMKDETVKPATFHAKEMSKMLYLHATLCETLRLFQPVPFMERTPVHDDTLPCVQRIKMMVIISSYAMERMASIWGDDCHEFKPERWISDDGRIKHEPPHKFFVFNTRQRVCLGKDFAFKVMKATAMAIIKKYGGKPHKLSTILQMEHGLMVTIGKRCG